LAAIVSHHASPNNALAARAGRAAALPSSIVRITLRAHAQDVHHGADADGLRLGPARRGRSRDDGELADQLDRLLAQD